MALHQHLIWQHVVYSSLQKMNQKTSLAPETLTNNFHVNDALCGANTIEDALRLQQKLIAILGRGGFHLRKFCASHPIILEAVPPGCREIDVPIELHSNDGIKTLGLLKYPKPLLEQREVTAVKVMIQCSPPEIITRFSTLLRMQRVAAYCLRFSHSAKKPIFEKNRLSYQHRIKKCTTPLH
jgi:hypothetical protein